MNSRRRPVQARSLDTVERILDAAASVLRDRGYHDCSTNRIADAAGVSKGSLYQYFADKDDVLTALAERIACGITTQISREIETNIGPDWRVLANAVLVAVFNAFDEYTPILKPLLVEAPHLRIMQRLDSITERAMDVGRTFIALNRAQFRAELDVEATLAVLVAGLRASLTDYVEGGSRLDRERLHRVLSDVALHSLVPDGQAGAVSQKFAGPA